MKTRGLTSKDINKLGTMSADGIRQLREPLLIAYDKYKTAVAYGEVKESEKEHETVLAWAQRLRDKDKSALDNIPEKVKYYL